MADPIVLTPIGVVRGGRTRIFEDHWGGVVSRLVLDPAVVDPSATGGLSDFSHIEVVFHFHREKGSRATLRTRAATRRGRRSACSPGTRRSARTTLASRPAHYSR